HAGVDDLAHERVAVAVDAARGEPEDRVALADRGAVDQAVALDHADAKADHLEVALAVEARHRGGLAAEQRTARAAAALGDPAQRLARELGVEASHREVVEEDDRLRALHDEVVHDHRDAVDADGVDAAELRREAELGADAVRARDEDRVLVAVGRLEGAGEAADRGEDLRPQRRPRDLLDLLDEALVAVEVDPRRGVARRRAWRRALLGRIGRGGVHARWIARAPAPLTSARASLRRVRISVVIPALDEAGAIAEAVCSAAAGGAEVLVVDGGSADGTPERA